ncbi:MAG: M50 family metallopeptidase [Chloroflexi bacterium]|nr:M50 family metallopeptidase [Chloroflexota bacterium]
MSGWPVGRLFGFEIRIHLSWILIGSLVAVLVVSQLEANAPSIASPIKWLAGAVIAGAFFLSVLAHELGHGIVARRRGLDVGPITVFFFGGSASFQLESDRPRDEAAVAIAGPIVSLVIGAVLAIVGVLARTSRDDTLQAVGLVALVLASLNLILGAANLVPAYPLDGGRLVRAVFWARTGDERRGARAAAASGRYVGWILVGGGLAIILLGQTADGLMLGLSGWLLGSASRAINRRLAVQELIEDVRVGDVVDREVTSVSPQLTVDTFAERLMEGGEGSALPVVRDDQVVGVVGSAQLRRVGRKSWATTRAEDVMIGPPSMAALAPGDSLWSALDRLRRTGLDGLPVMEAGGLVGVITRRLIASTIQDRAKLRGVTIR